MTQKCWEKVWHGLFKTYKWVLGKLGGDDFEVEHTGTKNFHMLEQPQLTLVRAFEL